MKQELRQLIEKLYDQYLRRKRWQKVVTFLAAVVVFCTTYALILPAITLETTCGYEEHVHEAVCYEGENIEGQLICEKEEHSHVEECYPDDEPEVISEDAEGEAVSEEETVPEASEVTETEAAPEEPEVTEPEEVQDNVDSPVPSAESTEEAASAGETAAEDIVENTADAEEQEPAEEVSENTETEENSEITEDENIEDAAEAESVTVVEVAAEISTPAMFGLVTNEAGVEITWELRAGASGSYTLYVNGEGEIPDNFVADTPELAELFSNHAIDKLIIGNDVTAIGQYAFAELESLEVLDFEEENVLTTIEGAAFVRCKNLAVIPLEKCTKLEKIEDSATGDIHGGAFVRCAISEIEFPESLEYIGYGAFYNCGNLTGELKIDGIDYLGGQAFNSTSFKKAVISNVQHINAALNNVTGLEEVEFTSVARVTNCSNRSLKKVILNNVAKLDSSAFASAPLLSEVIINDTEILGSYAFKACTSLTEFDFTGINNIGSYAFQNSTNLQKVSNFESVTTIGSQAFDNAFASMKTFDYTREIFPKLTSVSRQAFINNEFEEIVIGKGMPIANGLFEGCNSLQKVTFGDGWNIGFTDLFAGSTSKFDSIIGAAADTLYGENLQMIAPYTKNLLFEGENYLTITAAEGGNGLPAPLNTLAGDYYVDESGVLYLLDKENGTAALAYCPPQLTSYEVKTSIPAEGSTEGTYPVTAIEANAFALAADLSSLNGKITKAEAVAAVNAVLNLSADSGFTEAALSETAIENSETEDPGENENDYTLPETGTSTKETITYHTLQNEILMQNVLKISTSATESKREQSEASDSFDYYTGEYNNTTVSLSPKGVSDMADKVIRIYISSDAPGLEFALATEEGKDSYIYQGNTFVRKDLGNGSYYIDFPTITGDQTYTFDLEFKYPTLSETGGAGTPGGTVYLWGAILDKDAAEQEAAELAAGTAVISPETDGNYHKMNWTTQEDQFQVSKDSTAAPNLAPSEDLAVISGLSYTIGAERTNEDSQKQNLGEDFVKSFTYRDSLTLPEGISWREGVTEAIENGNWKLVGTQLIVTITETEAEVQKSKDLVLAELTCCTGLYRRI